MALNVETKNDGGMNAELEGMVALNAGTEKR